MARGRADCFFTAFFLRDVALQDGFYDATHDVIYNRLGITDQAELRQAEADYSIPAMLRVVLGAVELPGQFDAAHLKRIHQELFQDVYGWAGQTRANGPDGPFQGQKPTFVLNKIARQGEPMRYGPYAQLDQRLDAIGAQLGQENYLRGLDPLRFAERAAYYFDQYNHAHAFREGNGRTLQALLALLGQEAGYQVEISPAAAAQLNDVRDYAIIRPHGPAQPAQNLRPLALLLATAVEPLPGAEAAQHRDPRHARPLAAPSPEMQRIEALRTLQASAFIVGEGLRDMDKGDTSRGNLLLQAMNDVLHERATAQERGPAMQAAAQEVAAHPLLKQDPLAARHAAWLAASVGQLLALDQHTAPRLTPAQFTVADLPAQLLTRLGSSVAQLSAQPAQLSKLLHGEKTDPIPGFSLPPRAGVNPADLGPFAMRLHLLRDEQGKPQLLFDLPAPQRALVQAAQRPASPAEQPQNKPARPAAESTAPKPAGDAPKRKEPKPRR